MNTTMSFRTTSLGETHAFGEAVSELMNPGMTIVLVGGLGAGKTAFTQGVAKGLGIESRVTSPTFTMVATYDVDGRRGIRTLLHADLYRVGSGIEADDLAIGELVEEGAVAMVEWGDVAPDVLGGDQVFVRIETGSENDERIFHFVDTDDIFNGGLISAAFERWGQS